MKVTAKITGFKELEATLAELPKSTAKGVVRRVLIGRAKPVADSAASRAPVLSGDLRRSVAVTTKLSRRHRKRDKKGDVTVHIGTSPIGVLQEYGTRHHAPQPFMRPAWDAHKDRLLDGVAADMWAEIKKTVQRRAKKIAAKAGA